MIEVNGLVKQYGKKRAVDDIAFKINEGEIVGFLGPNGAGKSTTMNIITGYLSATEGTVLVDGIDVMDDPYAVRKKIGFLPEQPPLYTDMTVSEYLSFVYELKGALVPMKEHLNGICDMVGISNVKDRMIKNLSKGYKQRVGLAQALVGDPDVLIFDEPTVGLDPIQIIEIRNLIRALGKSRTVILSSHILPEVQAVCERVLVINNGVIVADDTPQSLSQAITGEHKLSLRISGEQGAVQRTIQSVPGVKSAKAGVQKEPGCFEYIVEADMGVDVRKPLFRALARADMPIMMMTPLDMSLEDIFLKLTADEKVPGAEKEESN